ncbi:tetratricopeptide repeat protein [Vibrio sp.]|nr:tetratricopeptide repeat protein [Vibrio sp.]
MASISLFTPNNPSDIFKIPFELSNNTVSSLEELISQLEEIKNMTPHSHILISPDSPTLSILASAQVWGSHALVYSEHTDYHFTTPTECYFFDASSRPEEKTTETESELDVEANIEANAKLSQVDTTQTAPDTVEANVEAKAELNQVDAVQTVQDIVDTCDADDISEDPIAIAKKDEQYNSIQKVFFDLIKDSNVDRHIINLHMTYPNDKNLQAKIDERIANAEFCRSQEKTIQKSAQRFHPNLEQAKQWVENEYAGRKTYLIKALKRKMKRSFDFIDKKITQKHAVVSHSVQLDPIEFIDGIHPNHLSLLPSDTAYDIYIDETGRNFESHSEERIDGKYVAMVVPKTLYPALPEVNNHATDNQNEAFNDDLVNLVTHSNVGVFGYSVDGYMASGHDSWLDGIARMITWSALMLPKQNKTRQLHIHVENRGHYDNQIDTLMFESQIKDKLAAISSDYADLVLSISFKGKKEPSLLPYVDAIAHMWGSKGKLAKSRLSQSKLRDHCLIQAGTQSLDNVISLAMLNSRLTPAEWYDLTYGASQLTHLSWISAYLDNLGHKVREDKVLWSQYLDFIQLKLANKNPIDLMANAEALKFLTQYTPKNSGLTPELELEQLNTELRIASHLGQSNDELFNRTANCVTQYTEENARLCAETVLGLFSMQMNTLKKQTALQNILETQIQYGLLANGRSNYAKLHSSLGQLHASNKDYDTAIQYFEDAIEIFIPLKHNSTRNKEIQQTRCYLMHALLHTDQDRALDNTFSDLLRSTNKSIDQLSHSMTYPYVHHTLVKAITLKPSLFAEQRKSYLSGQEEWQSGHTHPWQWINLYRGLLLQDQNDDLEPQSPYFDMAIQICQEQGEDLFMYMDEIIHRIAKPHSEIKEVRYVTGNHAGLSLSPTTAPKDDNITVWSQWLDTMLPCHYY